MGMYLLHIKWSAHDWHMHLIDYCGFCWCRDDGAHTVGDTIPSYSIFVQFSVFVVELEKENGGINDRRLRVDGMFLRYNWVCDSFNRISHNHRLENWIPHWQRVHNLQIKNSYNQAVRRDSIPYQLIVLTSACALSNLKEEFDQSETWMTNGYSLLCVYRSFCHYRYFR